MIQIYILLVTMTTYYGGILFYLYFAYLYSFIVCEVHRMKRYRRPRWRWLSSTKGRVGEAPKATTTLRSRGSALGKPVKYNGVLEGVGNKSTFVRTTLMNGRSAGKRLGLWWRKKTRTVTIFSRNSSYNAKNVTSPLPQFHLLLLARGMWKNIILDHITRFPSKSTMCTLSSTW